MKVDEDPSGAVFTDDRRHRIYLWRRWSKEGRWIMFIGLNPSTADERLDDPTIRRCVGFASRWGYGGMFMCNVFTLVSTDPKSLKRQQRIDRTAPLAMRVLRERCWLAVAAWGDLITQVRNAEYCVERIKHQLSPLLCFGLTKKGNPRHPLYLPYDTELVDYSA